MHYYTEYRYVKDGSFVIRDSGCKGSIGEARRGVINALMGLLKAPTLSIEMAGVIGGAMYDISTGEYAFLPDSSWTILECEDPECILWEGQ